jgi:hypothetical protein
VGPLQRATVILPRKYLISIGLLLFSAAGGLWGVEHQSWRLTQTEVIRDVVMRYQILLWAQGSRDFGSRAPKELDIDRFSEELASDGYLAAFGSHSPAETILEAWLDYPPFVDKSADDRGRLYGWILNKNTKRVVAVFVTGAISWQTGRTVQVDGAYFCGSLCAALMVFEVEFKAGKWTVVGESTRLVS